jgi:hypothetical protein
MSELLAQWPGITADTLLSVKTEALENIIGTAYAAGLQGDGAPVANEFDPDQPRGQNGRWTKGSPGSKVGESAHEEQNDQSRRSAQSPLESAKNHVGRGAEAIPGHDAPGTERLARVATEQERLSDWARQNNRVIPGVPERHTGGREHDVSFDPASGRVIKSTRLGHQLGYGHAFHDDTPGATPGEYLDRVHNANKLFGDDIRLEGVVPTAKGPSIVTSQPFIRGRDATPQEIDSYMRDKGFEKLGEGAYHHAGQGLLIHDLHSRNVKTDQAGIVHPIDPIIQRVYPHFVAKVKPLL